MIQTAMALDAVHVNPVAEASTWDILGEDQTGEVIQRDAHTIPDSRGRRSVYEPTRISETHTGPNTRDPVLLGEV